MYGDSQVSYNFNIFMLLIVFLYEKVAEYKEGIIARIIGNYFGNYRIE